MGVPRRAFGSSDVGLSALALGTMRMMTPKFDADSAIHLMDCGVAAKSNLHDVLFAPASTKFWIANATPDGKPAAEQKYHQFQLTELLARKPDPGAKEISLVKRSAETD